MNQILVENKNINTEYTKTVNKNNKNKRRFFKFQFIFCLIFALSITVYYAYSSYENTRKENLSKKVLNNYNITTLYNTNEYNASKANIQNVYIAEGSSFSIIGLIEIKNIQINYPIISSYNNELLKISPCRFMGPMPNEIGNLCIAGHNYNSYKFFSRLKDLSIGDTISIYDLSRK